MKSVPKKIRDDVLWKSTYKIVESIYSKIDDLATEFPAEQWTTANKLRNSANDSLFYTSQAVGNAIPEASMHDLNNARKNLFALQAMYIFAAKQNFLSIEPELIVEIDEILAEIDKRIDNSDKENRKKDKKELESWMKRYRLWQEMQS
jgi:hypothetical protein